MLVKSIQRSQSSPSQFARPGLSEIILPHESNELILPMLAHLSHQADDRWLTWVSAAKLPKNVYENYGFNLNNVRTINSSSDESTLWLMWEALSNSTSAFVVGTFHHGSSVGNREIQQLENACHTGQSRALILKFSDEVSSF